MNGLVVGQRAANGIIDGRTFIHPDSNFLLEFPEKWELENSPHQVVAVTPDGDGVIAVSAVAEGSDPLDGARAVEKSMKSSVADKAQAVAINGLPAARTHMDTGGKLGIDLTWIAHGGLIYQVAGIAPNKRFDALHPVFVAAAHSFRPLSADERAGVKETRIRLVKARAGETIELLAARSQSRWTREEIAWPTVFLFKISYKRTNSSR